MNVGKGGPLSQTDLEFLGYREVHEHQSRDFSLSNRCRVFDGTAAAGVSSVKHWFIYLLADASNKDIEDVVACARSGAFPLEQPFVVVPKSLSVRRGLVQWVGSPRKLVVFEDLMWGRIKELFAGYLKARLSGMREHKAGIQYVEPMLASTSGETTPIKHFVKFFSGASSHDGCIAVVRADAGVGKTTLAVMVADKLLQRWETLRVIPILLTAQTSWRDLEAASQGISNPWELLRRALDWEGHEFPVRDEDFFARIMQQGYIAFIFDGFDELRGADLKPSDTFAWMGRIASDSSARLMVTTRTSFWDRELGTPDTAHQLLNLKPFTTDNTHDYFRQHFKGRGDGEHLTQHAIQIHSQLRKASGNGGSGAAFFVNLPACAAMIADYVEYGGGISIAASAQRRNIIDDFFTGILERERVRQGITLNAENAKAMFGDVAVSYSVFSMEDIAIASANHTLTPSDIDAMRDHALLSRRSLLGPEKFCFKHEFLLHYLRADRIFALLELGAEKFLEKHYVSDLLKLIRDEADGKGNLTDQMANFANNADLGHLAKAYQLSTDSSLKSFALKSFVFHVVAKSVTSDPTGRSRTEHADDVFGRLGAKSNMVSGLHVNGSITDIALRGWTIADSQFTNLSLVGCDTAGAVFRNCSFSGELDLPVGPPPQFEKCKGDGGAELVISSAGGTNQHMAASDVRRHLKMALSRFRKGAHFGSLQRQDWKYGRTRPIEDRYELLATMLAAELVEEDRRRRLRIGSSELGNVRDFLDNGLPKGAVGSVLREMKSKIGAV